MPLETKDCPFCGEIVKAQAKKCKHCGEFLDGYTRDAVWNEINTCGGAVVGKDVKPGRDFVGRDQFNAETITLGKDKRNEQYQIVLNWDGKIRLRGFDLSKQNLSDLNLAKADLRGTDLHGANLSKANLTGADLTVTDLSEAYLLQADLSGSHLNRADLTSTNLFGTNLDEANLTQAIYNNSTIWPEGFTPPSNAIKI